MEAHLEGTGEPPRPESGHPARCFFNAEHGLATVEVELELPGVRTVSVGICAADAVRLSRGDEPEVGAVSVGRRRLPWAAAPTWYGGWGWGQDDLPALRYHGTAVFTTSDQIDALTGSTRAPVGDGDAADGRSTTISTCPTCRTTCPTSRTIRPRSDDLDPHDPA